MYAKHMSPVQQQGASVRIRTSLKELGDLWQGRIDDRAPFQYITRAAHWRDVILAVGPGVLIPRPETEQMIDLVSSAIKINPVLASSPWADLGCGSGEPTKTTCLWHETLFQNVKPMPR